MLPLKINDPTSWEGHLSGAIAGFFLAILLKKEGPVKVEHSWNDEEDETESDENKNEENVTITKNGVLKPIENETTFA